MKFFRHALFAIVLLLAQIGALTHAVEHLHIDADPPANHICALCLAAQGVDAALASAPPAITLPAAGFAQAAAIAASVVSAAAISPRARAPPAIL